ncbi:MAG: MBL fold metallo-hydrolase [Deltaproteobacteria bacterium]|nr:MAG: MBL fold metallo-hydrolase [Deltaproteobacteria bacterium]
MSASPSQPRSTRPSEGLTVLPLASPTLPPATTTNTTFVGRRDVWVVDPAPPWEAPREALLAEVRTLAHTGRAARGIVLTHHHPDHVGAAAWLREQTGLPILAHPVTATLLRGRPTVDRLLEEGDVLVGSDADDDRWQVLHTPGHAPGHLCLWEPVRRLLVAGDMVAATGTIVIAPPDGHMATYLAQLERLAALGPARLVPAHGAVVEAPVERLRFYVRHRLEREGRVSGALEAEPLALMALTERSYPDVPRALHGLASGSALAHLIKLEEEGRARRLDDGRWVSA